MNLRHALLFLIVVLLLPYPRVSSGAKIYKWVDEKGVVHFSDRQPDAPEEIRGTLEERQLKDPSPSGKAEETGVKLPLRNPIEYAASSTFTIRGSGKIGTGFFISPEGYAVTCRHVVEGGSTYTALLNDQSERPVSLVSISHRYDLALLRVLLPGAAPHLLIRNPESLAPGERIFAIGTSAGLQATITDGVFTGFRKVADQDAQVLQFSAPVNPGNSGGPLIDGEGKVLGVINAKYLMKNGIPISGVGFAVPSGLLKEEYGTFLP